MSPPLQNNSAEADAAGPEAVLTRFFNSIFGHTRNWPRAYDCLSPAAREKFDSQKGLRSFADYWDDKLSFLEELVDTRHREFPYTHRTCFALHGVESRELDSDRVVFAVRLVENHVASERLTLDQVKTLEKRGGRWLVTNGELEGNLDNVISVKRHRNSKAAGEAAV